jgi:hypothetical protein
VNFVLTGNNNPNLFAGGPSVDSSGTLSYIPAAGVNGNATITLMAKDNGGTANGGVDTTAEQSFTIKITPAGVPAFVIHPQSGAWLQGNTATLFASAGPTPSYQWYFNATPVSGATSTTLPIPNFQKVNEGSYHLVAMNTVGSATSELAILYLADPLRFVSNAVSGASFQYRLVGRRGSNFVFEASSTLSNWTALSTNLAPTGISDDKVPLTTLRYFRARLLP